MFWFKTIQLLVDSHKLDYSDKESYEKAIKILNKSLDVVRSQKPARRNKLDKLIYIEAMLNYDLAEIIRDGVLNGKLNDQEMSLRRKLSKRAYKFNSMHPLVFKRLSEVCNVTSSALFQK
jgi:hypothetical protein